MKMVFKFKFKKSSNKPKDRKNFYLYNIICTIIVIVVLIIGVSIFCQSDIYINMPIIGDNSNNNKIDIKISETTIVTLSTDETTVISDS